MPDIISSQVSLDQHAALPAREEHSGSVQAIITRGWNAYLVQVVFAKNSPSSIRFMFRRQMASNSTKHCSSSSGSLSKSSADIIS